MSRLRIAQYGTKHGHAEGKLMSLRASPRIELAGVFEPDPARRAALQSAGGVWSGVRWFEDEAALLGDPTVVAVAAEGRNYESLAHAEAILAAGKHLWYDKPAGDDWDGWRRAVALAEARGLYIQMGYMFRYHPGFQRVAAWAREGLLGEVYAVRAHMSTSIPRDERERISRHRGGILYDLGGHMLDQIVHILGRPPEVTSFLRVDVGGVPGFADNTLAVLGYPRALATVDIAAMEAPPPARRFEVYGTRGSAIMEPFEPVDTLRLCLEQPSGGFPEGEQRVPISVPSRQGLYDRELEAFVGVLAGERPPDRTLAHELLVQETLLRATGALLA